MPKKPSSPYEAWRRAALPDLPFVEMSVHENNGPPPPTMFLAWTIRGVCGAGYDDDLVYYGGVERIRRDATDEVRDRVMEGVMDKIDALRAMPVAGAVCALDLPVEVVATHEGMGDDVLVMYRVPFRAPTTCSDHRQRHVHPYGGLSDR